ncbi:MAG: dihydropteroate synthase [Negativicutes bacterium]|nr:dihydropteroate synthase [Negativicutes bacterium]
MHSQNETANQTELSQTIRLSGSKYSLELGGNHGAVLIGDALHGFWHPHALTYIRNQNWQLMQDDLCEQIGNGAAMLAIGWREGAGITALQLQAYLEFIQATAAIYPLLLDFPRTAELATALEQLPGRALICAPPLEGLNFQDCCRLAVLYQKPLLLNLRRGKRIPVSVEQRMQLAEETLTIALQTGLRQDQLAFLLPLPAATASVLPLQEALASLLPLREKFSVPVLVRPSVSFVTLSKAWMQSAVSVWALERGADAVIVNPNYREVGNITREIANLLGRPLQKMPLEMKRWRK